MSSLTAAAAETVTVRSTATTSDAPCTTTEPSHHYHHYSWNHHHQQTPQVIRPVVVLSAANQSPPTPTDCEIMTESCDWCMAETPWDAAPELFGSRSHSSSSSSGTTTEEILTSPPLDASLRNVTQQDKVTTRTTSAMGTTVTCGDGTTPVFSPPSTQSQEEMMVPNVNLRPRRFPM
jgi:hypothetical protein